jgi:hypothetical protein
MIRTIPYPGMVLVLEPRGSGLVALFQNVWLTCNHQFVENPAYNRDRRPAHIFILRLETEF